MIFLPGTKREDITGQRFGRLLVLEPLGKKGRNFMWRARCDCGGERVAQAGNMRAGLTTSCGCLHKEAMVRTNQTHGYSAGGKKRSEYKIWGEMIRRCHKPKSWNFKNYGERGISVCDRWRFGEGGLAAFECFIADMGDRPTDRHSIDRNDNSKGYSKENCAWVTYQENNGNRRDTLMVDLDGRTVSLISVCHERGLKAPAIRSRLRKGWPLDRALNEPLQPAKGPRNHR